MKQAKNHKKDNSKKTNKNSISFQAIKNLKLLNFKFETLPTNQNYLSSQETSYLRIITEILCIIPKIRLEQYQYVIGQQQLKKILVQLNRQSQNKQIILSVLKYILRGIQMYRNQINTELYQNLNFLIEIEELSISKPNQFDNQSKKNEMRKHVMSLSVYTLIQSILRWYCLGNQTCDLKDKYSKLILKMGKNYK